MITMTFLSGITNKVKRVFNIPVQPSEEAKKSLREIMDAYGTGIYTGEELKFRKRDSSFMKLYGHEGPFQNEDIDVWDDNAGTINFNGGHIPYNKQIWMPTYDVWYE